MPDDLHRGNGTDNGHSAEDDAVGAEQNISPYVTSRPGRYVTLDGLMERILEQFHEEHGTTSQPLMEAQTDVQRRMLVRDVAEYIISIESVQLSLQQRAHVIQRAYSEIFGFGPLDALFSDPSITTIVIDGPEKVSVRTGPGGPLRITDLQFDSVGHLKRILEKMLRQAGAEMRPEVPIIETGLRIDDKRISLNMTGPPYAVLYSADVRVHGAMPVSLERLVADGFMDHKMAQFLHALLISPFGLIIVGETESGKTTLLNALALELPAGRLATVERAGELVTGQESEVFVVQWPRGDKPGLTFAQQVEAALATKPDCILLDEIRADEPDALRPFLQPGTVPRQIWTFRGGALSKRIRSALSQVARLSDPSQPEVMVDMLYERLPFVIMVQRRGGRLLLREVAEWQLRDGYPSFVELLRMTDEGTECTGARPQHNLDLPEDFWD